VVAYTAMTLAAVALGRSSDVGGQLVSQLDVPAAAAYLVPMLGLLAMNTFLEDKLPEFKEMAELFEEVMVPQLRSTPPWGLAVMALGAGVGEEALFRAVLQPWLIDAAAQLTGRGTDLAAVVAGVTACAIIFGAAHALNAAYFVFATAAGAVFGVEYIAAGLPAAAATHAVYDFIAFNFVIFRFSDKEGPLED